MGDSLRGKTPTQYVKSAGIIINKLDPTVSLKNVDLSLNDGYIHLIRFIRSDCRLGIFGEKFKLPKKVKYEYVIATICTKTHSLQVRIGKDLIKEFEYHMPIEYKRY